MNTNDSEHTKKQLHNFCKHKEFFMIKVYNENNYIIKRKTEMLTYCLKSL